MKKKAKKTKTKEIKPHWSRSSEHTVSAGALLDKTCDFCGGNIGSYGTSKCPKCGETKCCAQCVPAGVGTWCIDCEENQ